MRVLLVEDDSMIAEAIRAGLQREGFTVDLIQDGRAAELALANNVYEICLLDLGLPRKHGLEVLKWLRASGRALPVLVITARDEVEERVAGLNCGADDYLVKPFQLIELVARVHALLRRRAGRANPIIELGPLRVNPITHDVEFSGERVTLSAREFAVLHALIEQPGAVLSREQLEERVYGWDEEVESNAIEVHLHNLRKKIGSSFIRNIRGVGYVVETSI